MTPYVARYDDGEPLHDDWLRLVRTDVEYRNERPTLLHHIGRVKLYQNENPRFGWSAYYGCEPIRDVFFYSRGDVRQLCCMLNGAWVERVGHNQTVA